MSAVVFFIAAIGAIAGAIGVVALRNPFYSVLALVGHLLSLAALFLLLRAEFVAAAQVVVYAGAVMVLYLFVVSYIGGGALQQLTPGGRVAAHASRARAVLALFAELAIAVLGSGLKAIDSDGAPYVPGFGTPGADRRGAADEVPVPVRGRLAAAARGRGRRGRARAAPGGGRRSTTPSATPAHCITPRSLFSGTMAEAGRRRRDRARDAEPRAGARSCVDEHRLVPGRLAR